MIVTLSLPDEAATQTLARRLAPSLGAGDTLLLSGPIGAGKSAFARALIRARLNDDRAEVPSPTYTLVQTYETPQVEIWHADLYRLTHPDDVVELGLDEALANALCLIEWPDRLGGLTPDRALHLQFTAGATRHDVTITARGDWPGLPRIAG